MPLCCLSPVPIPLCPSKALDPTELESEGLVLSLEEQLSALTLSKLEVSEPSPTVCLNGTCFKVELFDNTRRSTKVPLSPLCCMETWNDLFSVLEYLTCAHGKSCVRAELELPDSRVPR